MSCHVSDSGFVFVRSYPLTFYFVPETWYKFRKTFYGFYKPVSLKHWSLSACGKGPLELFAGLLGRLQWGPGWASCLTTSPILTLGGPAVVLWERRTSGWWMGLS